MIKKKILFTVTVFLTIMNCSSSKIVNDSSVNNKIDKDSKYGYAEFYKISTFATTHKEIYKLNEQKFFDLTITNYGIKDLFAPRWFDFSASNQGEIIIELYKKEDNNYKLYKQLSKTVETNLMANTSGREVLSSKKGEVLCFKNLKLDKTLKIVDKGFFKAKILIDLSNFGYFKLLSTDVFFEVEG